jgi:hypothetical protein
MSDDTSERYINPQAEIAKYSDAEHRQYEASQKEYWDYTSTLETAEKKGEVKGALKEKTDTETYLGIQKSLFPQSYATIKHSERKRYVHLYLFS